MILWLHALPPSDPCITANVSHKYVAISFQIFGSQVIFLFFLICTSNAIESYLKKVFRHELVQLLDNICIPLGSLFPELEYMFFLTDDEVSISVSDSSGNLVLYHFEFVFLLFSQVVELEGTFFLELCQLGPLFLNSIQLLFGRFWLYLHWKLLLLFWSDVHVFSPKSKGIMEQSMIESPKDGVVEIFLHFRTLYRVFFPFVKHLGIYVITPAGNGSLHHFAR